MIYTATTFKYAFDYKSTDVYWYAKTLVLTVKLPYQKLCYIVLISLLF